MRYSFLPLSWYLSFLPLNIFSNFTIQCNPNPDHLPLKYLLRFFEGKYVWIYTYILRRILSTLYMKFDVHCVINTNRCPQTF